MAYSSYETRFRAPWKVALGIVLICATSAQARERSKSSWPSHRGVRTRASEAKSIEAPSEEATAPPVAKKPCGSASWSCCSSCQPSASSALKKAGWIPINALSRSWCGENVWCATSLRSSTASPPSPETDANNGTLYVDCDDGGGLCGWIGSPRNSDVCAGREVTTMSVGP